MDIDTQIGLAWLLYLTAIVLGSVISLLLLYLVIRQGVFHGLRAHTRWIDTGKDYKKVH